jgi:predicted MFS family arabinose efflux permease
MSPLRLAAAAADRVPHIPAQVVAPGRGDDPAARSAGRRVVAALAVTQTVGYGVLYYAFAVFLTPLAAELDTSTTVITGAATLSVLVAAIAAVPVGRWLDRHSGRGLMTCGSILGTLGVLGWSQVHTVAQLYAVFALIGLASAMALYEPAFAVIVSIFDEHRRANGLLALTVVAGFASTIFLPLAGALETRLGWRAAVGVLAGIHALATIPLHAVALRRVPPRGSAQRAGRRTSVIRNALRDRAFWLMVAAFVAQGAAVSIVAVHLVAYLITLGHPAPFAATIAGLLGILSVTGRILTTGLRSRYRTATVTAAVFALQGIAAAALPLVGRSTPGAVTCVVLFGLGFGLGSLSRPALLAERYDTSAYASLAGTLALPATLAKAGAPLAAAAMFTTTGGYTAIMAAVTVSCLLAAAALHLVGRAP